MARYSTKEIVEILEDRIGMLQGQLDRDVHIIGNPEKNRQHWKREVVKAKKQIAQLK